MKAKRLNGSISVDTDSLDMFYYAFTNKQMDEQDATYKNILPRFLDFFKKKGIKATFFIVGSHIKEEHHRDLLRRMVDEGHELGNHTFTHPLCFSDLSVTRKAHEIEKCEKAIEEAAGVKPVGFRAPGWDIDADTMRILENRGYIYDSSVFPSVFNLLAILNIVVSSGKLELLKSMSNPMNSIAPLKPYHPNLQRIYRSGASRILEIPANATPYTRIPFYGTFSLATKSKGLFQYSAQRIYSARLPMNYVLHSAELYDREKDVYDKWIDEVKHPAFIESFDEKMGWYEYLTKQLAEYYNFIPLIELAQSSSFTHQDRDDKGSIEPVFRSPNVSSRYQRPATVP